MFASQRSAFYPVNVLRNEALNEADTSHVFLVDVDFACKDGLYDELMRNMVSMRVTQVGGVTEGKR